MHACTQHTRVGVYMYVLATLYTTHTHTTPGGGAADGTEGEHVEGPGPARRPGGEAGGHGVRKQRAQQTISGETRLSAAGELSHQFSYTVCSSSSPRLWVQCNVVGVQCTNVCM